MAKQRQKLAFIKDKDHLKYANLVHYEKALQTKDIIKEEYHVQSVLNSSSHAKNLRKEVFQSKSRLKITNKVDLDTVILANNDVSNNVINEESSIENKYSKITNITDDISGFNNEHYLEPDVKISLMSMIEEIMLKCDSDQLKVLAYYISSERIDNIVVEDFYKDQKFDELRTYVLQIWDINVNNINSLNDFVGSKHRTEIARKNLCVLIRDNFPLLKI